MRAVFEGFSGPGYFVQIPGMFHSNFTDVPNWFAMADLLGIAGPIDKHRAHRIINAYSLALFDMNLKGRPAALLAGPAEQYLEVLFETRGR